MNTMTPVVPDEALAALDITPEEAAADSLPLQYPFHLETVKP
jgi:hypothetical protein